MPLPQQFTESPNKKLMASTKTLDKSFSKVSDMSRGLLFSPANKTIDKMSQNDLYMMGSSPKKEKEIDQENTNDNSSI